jgi:hypothetical protein
VLGGTIQALNDTVALVGTYTSYISTTDTVTFGGATLGWGGSGAAVLAGPGTLVTDGTVSVDFDYSTPQVQLDNGITWENAGTVYDGGQVQFGTTLDSTNITVLNEAGAVFDLTNGNMALQPGGSGTYSFVNDGTLEQTANVTNSVSVPLNNTGLVSGDSGVLNLNGPVTNTGTIQSDGGSVQLYGGVLGGTIQNVGTNGGIVLTGTYTLGSTPVDTVTFGGAVLGTGGVAAEFLGSDTLVTHGSVSVTFDYGTVQLELAGGITWDNAGTVYDNGGVQFGGSTLDSATLVNQSGALFDLTNGNISLAGDGSGTYSFVNDGVLEQTANVSNAISVPLSNAGLVWAESGVLNLSGPVTNSGTILADGGNVNISGGVLGGTIEAPNGNVVLSGTYVSAAGTGSPPADNAVVFEGATFTGAELAGPGTLSSSGYVSITFDYTTPELVLAEGITWDNTGTVYDNGTVQFGTTLDSTGATLVNEAGAIFDLSDGNIALQPGGSGTYSFVNDGTLEQTANNTNSVSVPLTNNGLVSADSGVLDLSGPVTNNGTIQADGGTVNMFGGVLGGTIEAVSSGLVLTGTYTSAVGTTDTTTLDNVTVTGAVLAGPGTLASSGDVSVTFDYTTTELTLTGGITWENSGSIADNGTMQFGTAAADSATLVNQVSGVINLNGGNDSSIITGGAGTYALVNAGLLEQTGGGTTNIDVSIDDTGTIDVVNGDLTFNAGGTIAGLIEGANTVNFDGGNTTLTSTGDITVNTINFDPGTLYMQGGTISSPNLSVASGDEVIGYGTLDNVDNNGTVIADGGVLVITGSVTGTGVFESENGGALEFTGTVAGTYNNTGVLELNNNATLTTTGGFTNSGQVYVNSTGSGGGALVVGSTLTNSNYIEIGNNSLATTVTAQALANTGQIDIDGGDASQQAVLSIAGDAPQTWTGVVNVSGDALLEFGGTASIGTIAGGAQINLYGPQALVVASEAGTTTDTALTGLTSNAGQFQLEDGAALTIAGGLANSGNLYVNANGSGGSTLAIDGTLTNSGYVQVGNNALATTVTVQALDNTGQINIDGGDTTEPAVLSVAAAAPQTWTGTLNIGGDGELEFAGTTGIGTIGTGAQINLYGPQAIVATGSLGTTTDTALTALASNAGQFQLEDGATLTLTGGLANSGNLYVNANGSGGSTLAIDGTLANSGYVQVGNNTLATTITAQGLDNTGQINIDGGDTTEPAVLSIAADTPQTWTGTVNVSGDGMLEFGGTTGIGTIGTGAQINLYGPQAIIATGSLGTTTDTALTALASNAGQLLLQNGASLAITGGLSNSGNLYQDYGGNGASSLDITGALNNSGNVYVGDGSLPQATTLTVGGLVNTGYISVIGNYGTATEGATLDVNAIAGFGTTGVLTGSVFIDGFGVIAFTGGEIGTIASGASLELRSSGELADINNLGSNSALAGLTVNDGNLAVRYGNAISLTGNLLNAGNFYLQDQDNNTTVSVNSIAGTLTNTGDVYMGNLGLTGGTTLTVGGLVNSGYLSVVGSDASAAQGATVDVNAIAGFGTTGVLTGSVFIDGTGVIAFASGQIGTIATGASLELRYLGELADIGNLGSSSALAGLTVNDGNLYVRYGNAISLTGNLLNAGNFYLQDQDNNGVVSVNSIAGTLTNTGDIYIGNLGLTAPTTLTVGGLVNSGYLSVIGSDASLTDGATLDVNAIAGFGTTGVLTGSVYIDGTGVIEFASGQIGTIAAGASLELRDLGELADAGSLGSNSALAGLTVNDGDLIVRFGNAISLTGNLLNAGNFYLQDLDTATAADVNTIAGTLTNSGYIYMGSLGLSQPTTLTVGGLVNSDYLSVVGSDSSLTNGATLDVNAIAGFGTTGVLTGSVYLDGTGVIAFASGQIGTVAAGASLELRDLGEVADIGNLGSSSALSGLTENDGNLLVRYGDSISLTGNLLNTGNFYLQDQDSATAATVSTIAGTLTNTGDVYIGNTTLSQPTTLAVGGLVNNNSITIQGNTSTASDGATLTVNGAASSSGTTNIDANATIDVTGANTYTVTGGNTDVTGVLIAGTIAVDGAGLQLSGGTVEGTSLNVAAGGLVEGYGTVLPAITGAGTVEATGGTLDVQGGVSGSTTLAVDGASTLQLGGADSGIVDFAGPAGTFLLDFVTGFTGTIDGFALGDTVVLNNTTATAATATFNSATDTSTVAVTLAAGGTLDLTLGGNYAGEGFAVTQSGTDSDITLSGTAVGTIVTPTPVNFGDVHTGATVSEPLDIMNDGAIGAASLDVTVGPLSGAATGSGSITDLAPQASNDTGITVGLNTGSDGIQTGTVTLNFASDDGGGNTAPLPSQSVGVTGTVYNYATPSVTAPTNLILHVGQDGGTATEALTIANIAPDDGYSEGLDAAATGAVTGNLTGASGSTGDIAAGGSDTSSVTVSFSTATAGYINGTAIVALTSNGTGVDTLGQTPLYGATYSAVNNFSTLSNPNGVWAYLTDGNPLSVGSSGSNYASWWNGGSIPDSATITENTTTTTQTYSNTVNLPPNYLNLDPESVGNVAVQFTAPTAGVYTFTGGYLGTDVDENAHTVAVIVNGTTAESGTISSYGQTIDIALTETLAAGGIVDFVSESPSSYNNLGTGLKMVVTTGAGAAVPVTATIDNYATAAIQQVGSVGALSQVGNTYTLDLGTFANGIGTVVSDLDVANTASGPADWLSGILSASGDSAFSDTGLGSFGTLGAGGTTPFSVDLSTTNSGVFSQTITLAATDSNASGYSEALAGETIDVVGTVLGNAQLAQPVINTPTPIALADAHVAPGNTPTDLVDLSISNDGSATLSGSVGGVTGTAYGSGSFSQLAPGGSNTTSIAVGVNNTSAGALSGDVTIDFQSGPSLIALNPQTIAVSGSVYRLASPSITTPASVILHVGDGGGTETETLTVANTDPADGYSEGLVVTALGSAGGDVSGASGTTGDIAAQGTNDTALTVTVSTTAAANSGSVALAEYSDGTGVDTLGTTSLGTVDVPINVTVDNYATAAMEQLGGDGTLTPTGVADTYTLNLGATDQYASALTADLGALNAAAGPAADLLDGSFAISGDSEYADTGFGPFSGVSFGNAAGGNDVVLNTGTIGVFTQQITLTPTGTNASGYSGSLTAETIDVVGTIVPIPPPPPPPLPTAIAWGDVHLTTFDGLYYNFQAEGEFVLAESTVAGDSFQVQARLQPWSSGSTVSVMTMIAAEVGTDRVTFALGRADTVWVDGSGVTFAGNGASVALSGGTITQVSSTSYQVNWDTGEVMDITDAGTYLNMSLALSASDGPGSIQGLLGSDSGQANDFALPNGTVLSQPLSSATLYGEYADAWRVTDSTSLMDYLAGQTTATFTDDNFPADSISIDSLPAAIVAAAEAEVAAAGITNPNLAAAAVIDLLVTGDPNSLLNDLDINQNGEVTDAAEITSPAPPVPALGVSATATNVVENASGTTTVTFTAYLTAATGTDTVIDWAVTAPNSTFLGTSSFGGTLPSGFVVIPAGQTTENFTVTLPAGVLGTAPSSNLQVTIASTNGDPIFGQTAQTEIDNYQPEPGNPAVPELSLLSGAGIFSGSGDNYTLNIGTLVAGEYPVQSRLQFSNDALAPSDLLAGSITATGTAFTVYGAQPLTPLAAGSSYQGLVLESISDQTGAQTETIVIDPVDENITGYSSMMAAETLTITDTVLPDAVGDLLTSGPINLGSFYEGNFAETALSIMNAAAAGSANLDVTAISSGGATATGEITGLAPGATDSSTIEVGINTSSPGVQTGTITLDYTSDAGNGNIASEGTAQIVVTGTVYGPAVAELAAAPVYVHVGQDGGSVVVPITIANTAPNNPYAEKLDAQIISFGTYVTAASGSISELAPGQSNDTALTATLSDENYGAYAGEVAIALQSNGTGVDNEGTTSLGTGYVQAVVDVDQYAVAAMEQISGNGSLVPTGVATDYSLDLGTVAQYSTPLGANLGVLNDVLGQADLLGGSFSISGAPEFYNTGFTPFGSGTETAGLAAGQVDSDPVVVLTTGTVGTFTETITLDPIGYNPSGYSGTLAPITVTVTGTVVAAPPPVPPGRVADAWGDVHLTTFDGLYYNFQAEGEFVLTESTIPGDTFAIQARMQPWSTGSSVSVNTMIAAQVGDDRVTFAIDRPDVVWIDGVAQSMSSPVINLADGTLEQTSADAYTLIWNTGEELQVTDDGSYLSVTVSLPSSDAGNVQGLLGPDNGNPDDDLQLPNGTPIETNGTITYAELYGTFAAAWRVTDATSLMDYGPGQDTASFTNVNFPYNQISLGNLPANAVAQALAAAEAAGITDPNLQQAAIEDYLFTGNPEALAASENVQEQEGTALSTAQTLTAPPPIVANVGIEANVPTMIESGTIAESVGFTIYLTSPGTTATVVDYQVTDPGPGYLTAADFGGVLPSGTVTVQAGETTALFTVELPAGVLGSQADENLQVTISSPSGETVFAPQAQTQILNTGPTAGNPAVPVVEKVSGDGSLSGGTTFYELNLGSVEQFSDPLLAGYGVENGGVVPADLLSGSFVVDGSSQFLNSGLAAFDPIAAGSADTAPEVELLTNQVGTFTENVTLTPTDSNLTNYSSIMPQVTIEIVGTITAPPPPPPPPVAEATAWGDVHITTFDGVYYNFQAAGEYVLTRSTVAGDTFQVQARLQPWFGTSSVTVQTQVGAAIGSDDVVFALTGSGYNSSPFYLNGTADALGVGQTLTLSGGTVTETSDNTYLVDWNTGESMTVMLDGSYISDTIELTAADAGKVQGLLGPDDGNASTDLQLANGQPIGSNGTISSSTLYGTYASDWQVPNTSSSLLYYTAGQSPSTFLIPGFPENALTLSQLPASLVAAAEAIVEAEGITNPNLIDAAVIDLLATGNPNSVFSTANVQEEGVLLSAAAVSNPTPLPSVGVMADATSVLEVTSGTLAVEYTVYLTAASSQTSTIDYSVIGSGVNNLGTADIVGGTGSGVVQIAAGQTSTQITVDVLANALGSLPDAELEVGVTATGGESLFGGTAETQIVNPTPTAGNPASALIEQLGGDGTLTGSGTSYSLNLGTQVQNGSDLFANLGVENDTVAPADDLSGQFTITNFTNYLNTGFSPFSDLAPGTADTEPVVSLNTGTIGVFTETVVLDPTDTNATGYSGPMNDVTLTVTGTIVPAPLPPPPPLPTAIAWGDVHLTTFDGLYYNFMAVGEFTLAKSTVSGDGFDVQIRTEQYNDSSVSVIDQVAVGFGSDDDQHVTFGLVGATDQPYAVMQNGTQAVFTNGVLSVMDGSNAVGTVTEESPTSYLVNWDTGESMTVSLAGSYINTTVALAAQDENGNVEGLLGYDSGINTDFEPIVSGTTITTDQLYYGSGDPGDPDSLADFWRVSQAQSLLYYAPGTDTANYTDLDFPADALTLADLPQNLQQEGLDEAIQAGITDPQLQQAAALDYIVTGDPSIVVGAQNVQQQGITTTDSDVTGATVTPALGVAADNTALIEGSGDLSVGFTVYLTQAESQATTMDYAVTVPGAGFLNASDFAGDILPSGTVTIAANQTSATFSVTVPTGALGDLPSSDLQVTISPTGSESVFAPTAQTTIVNNQVEPGTPSDPVLALLTGAGTLTEIGNAYTLALGNLAQGETVLSLGFAIENTATVGSNDLAGSLAATSTPGFTVSGTGPLPVIAAGNSDDDLHVAVNTGTVGSYSETITFTPVDQNVSGYSADDAPITLTITDSVAGSAASANVSPNPVNFGNVHVGATPSEALSVTNTATSASAQTLSASIGSPTGAATDNGGSFTGLAEGDTNDTSLVVGLSTTSDGVQSGTATISLESGTTDLPSQVVSVLGTVYAYADPVVSNTTLDFGASRVGDVVAAQSVGIADGISADPYQESLLYSLDGTAPTGFSNAGGDSGTVVSGGTAQANVTLNTSNSGSFSATDTLSLTSTGAGTSGLASTTLTSDTITLDGVVYTPAVAEVAGSLNFGVVHVGSTDAKLLSIKNGATAGTLTDVLIGSLGTVTGAGFSGSGSLGAGLAAGASSNFDLVLNTATSGVYTGSAVLDLATHDTAQADAALTVAPVTLTGTVDNYATAAIGEITGGGTLSKSGESYTLSLGTLTNSSLPALVDLAISNSATGVADLLSGSLSVTNSSSIYVNNGDSAFARLAAGQSDILPTATLSNGTYGAFTETITLTATGSNASGYSGILPTETLTLTGTVVPIITLTTGVDIVNGNNNVTIDAATETLSAGDRINGGSGVNTLDLIGGGFFYLQAPAVLENIQIVNATEGTGANLPQIWLRNGTDLTLNLLPSATNPQTAGADITGANNDDTINLGAGDDIVILGGTGETVNGGSGYDTYYVTSVTIGGTIVGGTGTNLLAVQGGGTMAMGANITGIDSVLLLSSASGYNFTANATPDMVISAGLNNNDTITVGSASQTVIGSTGNLLVLATAANAGVNIDPGTGSNELEITTGGTFSLNNALNHITVVLDAASTVTLPLNGTVVLDGTTGNDMFVATSGLLRAGQQINGGTGTNTLELEGGGSFNLAAPATLTNIRQVDATEGQGAAMPNIYLRNGTDLTLTLASSLTDPQSSGAVVYGADNTDTINLGAGLDSVVLGGTGETVNGGSGTDAYYVTAATIGATIAGGSGSNVLVVQGGGTMTMGANLSGINSVILESSGTSYNFTANSTADLAISAGADNDTITVASSQQSVVGKTGNLLVLATAANAGAIIYSGTGSNELEITTSGAAALDSLDNNLTVLLSAANTTLTLNRMEFIHAEGSGGSDVIIAGAAGQVLTGGGTNDTLEDAGHYGVTFQDTIAGIQNDTLADFSSADKIDITNLVLASVTSSPTYTGTYGATSSGTLAIPTSSGPIGIKLTGLAAGGTFTLASDTHGGTFVTYT